MSDQTTFDVNIKSAKFGINDSYEFQLEKNHMKIGKKTNINPAICVWQNGSNPIWMYANTTLLSELDSSNPFENELEHEMIYPPTNFVRALVSAWTAWRNDELNNEQVQSEIRVLCEWLNTITDSKPKTDFWKNKF